MSRLVIGFFATMILTAYMTRWLQVLEGPSKRDQTDRVEEPGGGHDQIPLTEAQGPENLPPSGITTAATSTAALSTIQQPPRSQDPSLFRPQDAFQSFDNMDHSRTGYQSSHLPQSPLSPLRSRRWAAFLTKNLDWMTYLFLFLIGTSIYYAKGYAMPLHLTTTILSYYVALQPPPRWRQYLHPVLTSALLTVLVAWAFAATKSQSLQSALAEYRTGIKYLQLWHGTKTNRLPGAGDVLGSVLDASIVSLALPMYQHRRELKQHFVAIVVPSVVLSIGSLFSYPILCFAVGVSAERSLAFAARSLTLALATPATENLGGDTNTVAAVAIMSGIIGALLGQRMLAMLKIPEGKSGTLTSTIGGAYIGR